MRSDTRTGMRARRVSAAGCRSSSTCLTRCSRHVGPLVRAEPDARMLANWARAAAMVAREVLMVVRVGDLPREEGCVLAELQSAIGSCSRQSGGTNTGVAYRCRRSWCRLRAALRTSSLKHRRRRRCRPTQPTPSTRLGRYRRPRTVSNPRQSCRPLPNNRHDSRPRRWRPVAVSPQHVSSRFRRSL